MTNEQGALPPLWADNRIDAEFDKRVWKSRYANGSVAQDICHEVRDSYEAALAWLRNQREQDAVPWQPVPHSLEFDLVTHAIRTGAMPIEYRICRRVPTPAPVAPQLVIPSNVKAAINQALSDIREGVVSFSADEYEPIIREWLESIA